MTDDRARDDRRDSRQKKDSRFQIPGSIFGIGVRTTPRDNTRSRDTRRDEEGS